MAASRSLRSGQWHRLRQWCSELGPIDASIGVVRRTIMVLQHICERPCFSQRLTGYSVHDNMGKGHPPDDGSYPDLFGDRSPRDTKIQVVISLALGLSAFLTFCVLRPRWPALYAARKKQKNEATVLPELPSSLFGWIIPLWRISDQQVLASAGLDAYVFLAFFKMAIKFLLATLPLALIVIKPVHDAFPEGDDNDDHKNGTTSVSWVQSLQNRREAYDDIGRLSNSTGPGPFLDIWDTDYLWMYIIFAYLFTGIAVYLIISETRKIIAVRQEFLGTQTTVTDRTIRLSGIPRYLQDEGKIKDFIESLYIGKVESVMLCRQWKELDEAMVERTETLRRLEEAYTVYTGYRTIERNHETLPISQPSPPGPIVDVANIDEESTGLLNAEAQPQVRPYAKTRPKARLRYGVLRLRSRQVDAIDYYEEQLRKADEHITYLRTKEFPTTPQAFVTMDSVAACQMAIQAVLDPLPLQLIANESPAPSDVIWPNTYLSRRSRMMRSWSITALIVVLTVLWTAIQVPIAGLLNIKTIEKVSPQLAEWLKEHDNIQSLVQAQLPTILVSLLTTLVPYLYYWLSWYQGFLSQGDIELSSISKNFFFAFFTFFIIFTLVGTGSNFYEFFQRFGDSLRNFQSIAYTLALSLQKLLKFYVNLIILQGLGLLPFRLLEFGSVSLYPIYLIGAKTPRDYAELVQPPLFVYGYYLPSALLIFIICMVYSVLRSSWQILLAGLAYFVLGHFVYKYQLLYAMDHRQQSTGRAWVMICDRIFVGLLVFQLSTAGQLILKNALPRGLIMVPLLIATIWIAIFYGQAYKPLMRSIALSSVERGAQFSDSIHGDSVSITSTEMSLERNVWAEAENEQSRAVRAARRIRQAEEASVRFINPSLIAPLDKAWMADLDLPPSGSAGMTDGPSGPTLEEEDSM